MPFEPDLYEAWAERNLLGGIDWEIRHAYRAIMRRDPREFAENKSFLCAGATPERANAKFDLRNPALRRLVIKDALQFFEANPAATNYSIGPSDGDGWCGCENGRSPSVSLTCSLVLQTRWERKLRKGLPVD